MGDGKIFTSSFKKRRKRVVMPAVKSFEMNFRKFFQLKDPRKNYKTVITEK